MAVQAPYSYIRDYYDHVHRKATAYPNITTAWMAGLGYVHGAQVLNVGCGPQLYDYVPAFAGAPRSLVGLDINENTFAFLRRSRDPRLLRAKRWVRDRGVRVEHVCADAFACPELHGRGFDTILGVGFFATFEAASLARLLAIMARALRPGGMLVKITWHGPWRSAEETEKKLRYGYDNAEEPAPDTLVRRFADAGFRLHHHMLLPCESMDYGWRAVQICAFVAEADSAEIGGRVRAPV